MNKQTFITALLSLVAIVANAQQRLTVRDSLTQEPSGIAERATLDLLMQCCPGIVDHLDLQDIASFLNVYAFCNFATRNV